MERIFQSTPNGVLMAHSEWLPGVRLHEAFSTTYAVHIEDFEGWYSCLAVVAQWQSSALQKKIGCFNH